MSASTTSGLDLSGFDRLSAALGAWSQDLGARLNQQIGREAAALALAVKADLGGNGPLVRSIRATSGTNAAGQPQASVGSDLAYARFVEFGTAPHLIEPVNARVLAFAAGGGTVFAARVNHPGTAAHPFLEQGLARVMPGLADRLATAALGAGIGS